MVIAIVFITVQYSSAQELEPRSISNAPVGTNFAAFAYGFSDGNVLYDPALPVDDVSAKVNVFAAAYVHSFNFFGMNAKYNVILPYVIGDWEGYYEGIDTATSRLGIADLSFGFSFNFIGSPAINAKDFKNYTQKTIVGGSVQVIAPTGQYFSDRLINVSSNRWAVRPQLGISHKYQSWYFEFFSNVWLYADNNSFWNGKVLKQTPIVTFKTHLIKSFENGAWVSFGAGYAIGGRSYVNDIRRDSKISTIRTGVIAAIPLSSNHTIKLTGIVAKRIREGADFNLVSIAYQYMWNNKL